MFCFLNTCFFVTDDFVDLQAILLFRIDCSQRRFKLSFEVFELKGNFLFSPFLVLKIVVHLLVLHHWPGQLQHLDLSLDLSSLSHPFNIRSLHLLSPFEIG